MKVAKGALYHIAFAVVFIGAGFSYGVWYQGSQDEPLLVSLRSDVASLAIQLDKANSFVAELTTQLDTQRTQSNVTLLKYEQEVASWGKQWEAAYSDLKSRYDYLATRPREYIPSRQWESVQQFIDWYNAQKFTILLPNSTGKNADCDDYADWVQNTALQQGYAVSIALTWNGRLYNGQVVTDKYTVVTPGHAGGMVDIQGSYYYFEPMVNDFKGLVKVTAKD